jgi:hypothetical protein
MSDLRTHISVALFNALNDPKQEWKGHLDVDLLADAVISELPELHKHNQLKTIQHQQVGTKVLQDPDMIAADQEWRDKHAACLGCGLPLPHAAGEYTCLNCKVTLDELQAWQAVVDGELVRPLCRGCWTATTAGECKRGDR